MSGKTGIEWCDATWNPVRGCSRVSPGCQACYAERQAIRQAGEGGAYEGLVRSTPAGPRWTGQVRLVPELLDQPAHWRRPRVVFVNSMSDLGHPGLTSDDVSRIHAVMKYADWHTFIVLTKRPERLLQLFPSSRGVLPNVWLGSSCEDQQRLDARGGTLLELAMLGWNTVLSLEPALGPMDLTRVNILGQRNGDWPEMRLDLLRGLAIGPDDDLGAHVRQVIVGGETGSGFRDCQVGWIRSIHDQCRAAGVPCFVKQDSGPKPGKQGRIPDDLWACKELAWRA